MYAMGLLGVLLLLWAHIKTIIFNIARSNYLIAAFFGSSLIIIPLQEGHYNSSQAFIFLIFLILFQSYHNKGKLCVE